MVMRLHFTFCVIMWFLLVVGGHITAPSLHRRPADVSIRSGRVQVEDMVISWTPSAFGGRAGPALEFAVTLRSLGEQEWAAVGFNSVPLMVGADMCVLYQTSVALPSSRLRAEDRFARDYQTPSIDERQDCWLQSVSRRNGSEHFRFRRLLDTGDPDDFAIRPGLSGSGPSGIYLVWAYGMVRHPTASMKRHLARGYVPVKFFAGL
eukprot:NODE_4175_length_850_cov_5.825218_g3853_i0.p1 GENE.NODE_4175_length_850_cov_5.825218_g3853_i0~~NODE_4175_length_850_cov_5.825218_g3853_i0.p1  ORF type:complete len:206 (+),score=18.45 NODE_4175_length_850_cov_5.825218_g3853_i0:34-651(+)